jgi:glutathione synthase/RimK-type ligase-like ATP-grasp enzyme
MQTSVTNHFHLAVAWDWELDRDFVSLLEKEIHLHHLSFYSVSHHNAHETVRKLHRGELTFGAFLDRASESDENFQPLVRTLRKSPTLFINTPDAVHHAIDKATMHLEFITKGIDVPFSIIISPYNKKREVELRLSDLAMLGRPFIIKPANTTGGGVGVVLGAETLRDVVYSRQHHKNDKYLLQEKISPMKFAQQKAWFRVFCVFGNVTPCWWDDETHIYRMVSDSETVAYGLGTLETVTQKIHEVCKLDFFSTEIAATHDGKFVVVDYVNDICDMRLQSRHHDGVPDGVVQQICRQIAKHLKSAEGDTCP